MPNAYHHLHCHHGWSYDTPQAFVRNHFCRSFLLYYYPQRFSCYLRYFCAFYCYVHYFCAVSDCFLGSNCLDLSLMIDASCDETSCAIFIFKTCLSQSLQQNPAGEARPLRWFFVQRLTFHFWHHGKFFFYFCVLDFPYSSE